VIRRHIMDDYTRCPKFCGSLYVLQFAESLVHITKLGASVLARSRISRASTETPKLSNRHGYKALEYLSESMSSPYIEIGASPDVIGSCKPSNVKSDFGTYTVMRL